VATTAADAVNDGGAIFFGVCVIMPLLLAV
jgi:hypothetical protein